ncbi:hypothetical protein [Verrucomicrobium sp. BvORR106]|uniref:hypothetical protein n=1 Tax=Verrucomicrobium sp. BvORR106 TaxID=1403819 RepID=UPI000571BEF2|nr:hypothetical protein [Verrucomicrobium sp. BvORR106]
MKATPPARSRKLASYAPWGLAAGIALALLLPLPQPAESGWEPLLWDWGHVPLFAALGWSLVPRRGTEGGSSRRLLALLCLVILPFLLEGMQALTSRNPDWLDGLHGVLGGLAGYSIRLAGHRSRGGRWGLVTMATMLILIASWPLIWYGTALISGRNGFPQLTPFEWYGTTPFWAMEMEGTERPLEYEASAVVLPVTLKGHTSLQHWPPQESWAGHTRLSIQCRLAAPSSFVLGVRVDGEKPTQSLRLQATVNPGGNDLQIPLTEGGDASTVLQRVHKLTLFTQDADTQGRLVIEKIQLLP